MAQLNNYAYQLGEALRRQDGRRVAELLATDGDALTVAGQLAQTGRPVPAGNSGSGGGALASNLPPPWGDVASALLRCLVAQHRGERAAACKDYRDGVAGPLASLLNADKGTDSEWLIPPALGAAAALKGLSELADTEMAKRGAGSTNGQLAECAIALQHFFRGLTSKSSAPKREASVALVCLMMKVYFKLNAINNCKQPLQQLELNKLFDGAKMAHKVTLRYYTGILASYDEDFQRADEHLTFAFERCPASAHRNIRRVLRYLIPVKMLLGVLPAPELLQRFGFPEYEPIRAAVAAGDVGLLLSSLEANQTRFIRAGTYLLLERLQLLAYRRLLRRCAAVHAELHPGKAHQLPLSVFEAALQLQGVTKEPLELLCLVANLIFRKYVKGYLAYKQRVLVLAKAGAFPPLGALQLADPLAG